VFYFAWVARNATFFLTGIAIKSCQNITEVVQMPLINSVGNKIGSWSFKRPQKDLGFQENQMNGANKEAAQREQALDRELNSSDAGLSVIIDKLNSSKTIV
jgi:hypothetical protein